MNAYVGNPLQIRGVEQYVLQGGKGDGMHFLCVRNGLGLQAWISLDRCGDLSRVTFKGDNMGFFAPCGYVAPTYYDCNGRGFLKSFTAGFFTTCGLTHVGDAGCDDGEDLPMHGTISHVPATLNGIEEDDRAITVRLTVRQARLFGFKLVLRREYVFSLTDNTVTLNDRVQNETDKDVPYMVLYHCNMGYPLLDETSRVEIPHTAVRGATPFAQAHIADALQMEAPQAGIDEQCFFYDMEEHDGIAHAGIYNEHIGKGVVIAYEKAGLPCFTEWKMMGQADYVLGLEPGNCNPIGRTAARESGSLRMLAPQETAAQTLTFCFVQGEAPFDARMKG